MKTFREIKSKYCDADIEVEHYEDMNFKPMSAVFVDGGVLYYEEDEYGTTPMDKEPVKCEIEPPDDRFSREAYEGNYGTI